MITFWGKLSFLRPLYPVKNPTTNPAIGQTTPPLPAEAPQLLAFSSRSDVSERLTLMTLMNLMNLMTLMILVTLMTLMTLITLMALMTLMKLKESKK